MRGDYGSGKTRFLLVVGSICYKPMFASGASTVSPIFHILDAFRGTLIIDEGDFRWSDDKADIVKILNNGNVRGLPVLRTVVSPSGEFNPRAFRCLAQRSWRPEGSMRIEPSRAASSLKKPAIATSEGTSRSISRPNIRTKRCGSATNSCCTDFGNYEKKPAIDSLVDPTLEPRLNQIFVPLLSVIDDPTVRAELRELARERNREIVSDRGMEVQAQVLEVIRELQRQGSKLSVGEITAAFIKRCGQDFERPITNKWIGYMIRRDLHIKTRKSNGTYIIPLIEDEKLRRLYEKYGITDPLASDPMPLARQEAPLDIGEAGEVNADNTPEQ